MRKLSVTLVLLCLATVAHGQIKIVGKESAEIVIAGESGSTTVYYTGGDEQTAVSVTPIGPLTNNNGITLTSGLGQDATTRYIEITVMGRGLKPGQVYTGSIVLSKDKAFQGSIPVSVTVAAPTIAVDAIHADLCVTCDGPHVIPVRIRNTGQVPVQTIHVGALALHARGFEWVVPAPDKEQEDGTDSGTTDTAGDTTGTTTESSDTQVGTERKSSKITAWPGSAVPLALQPNESRVIYVAYDPPRWAGDYAGSIEIAVPGADAVKTSITLRSRGPYIDKCIPLLLFVGLLAIGIVIAWKIEDYLGAGKGQVRDDALVILDVTRTRLREYRTWIQSWDTDNLPRTRERVELNIRDVQNTIEDAGTYTADGLKEAANELAEAYAKRRALRDVLLSRPDPKAVAKQLDAVDPAGPLKEYRAKLDAVTGALAQQETRDLPPVVEDDPAKWPRFRRRWIPMLRRLAVIAVSFLTAFLALYYGKCAFGTWADYAYTFFWGLGVTTAGNALIREGDTKYKREGET